MLFSQRGINTRETLPNLLNDLNLTGWGAEIGVWEGYFSEVILKESKLSLLFSIDAWSAQYIKDKWSQNQIDEAYKTAINRLLPFRERSICLRATSILASQLIPNESLDFVFIDALHTYDAVRQDLTIWWDKVKSGGVFSGHDFFHRENKSQQDWGVIEAVEEFAAEKSFVFQTTSERMASWYGIKP